MVFVIAMTEVESGYIHTLLNHALEHLN